MRPQHSLAMNINFSDGTHLPEDDVDEARSYGVTCYRLNIISYTSSTVAVDRWKALVEKCLSFADTEEVIFGFSSQSPTITSDNWVNFHNACVTLAAWFQEKNDNRLIFQIGNEEEMHHDGSITNAQIRANIRTLATAVKTVYNIAGGKVIYSSSIAGGSKVAPEVTDWASEGRGDLDIIAFNLYGNDTLTDRTSKAIYDAFGSHGYVTEWGIDNGYQTLPIEVAYEIEMKQRMMMIKRSGIPRIYYYNWMESGNRWGMKIYPDTDKDKFRSFFRIWLGKV